MILRMNTDKFFTPLGIKAGRFYDYLNELVTKEHTWEKHFGFDAIPVDSRWIKVDYALRSVDKLQPIRALGVLRVPPNSFYNFHRDSYRLSTINMLIKQEEGYCYFIEPKDEHYSDITELVYEPRTYYLFNNQAIHGVINRTQPRYMLSLYFQNETKYSDLQAKLASLKA